MVGAPLTGAVPAAEEEDAYRAMAQGAPDATLVPLSRRSLQRLGGRVALHHMGPCRGARPPIKAVPWKSYLREIGRCSAR